MHESTVITGDFQQLIPMNCLAESAKSEERFSSLSYSSTSARSSRCTIEGCFFSWNPLRISVPYMSQPTMGRILAERLDQCPRAL